MTRCASDSPSLFSLPEKPDFSLEAGLLQRGSIYVAGTDEAGRGPLAGPVVAAAVILNPDDLPEGLDDSKRLSKVNRETAFNDICGKALAIAFASASAEEIDVMNILRASLDAMTRAVAALSLTPHHVLIDGRDIPNGLPCPGTALIKGDQRSISVAAASIVAKVMRDRMMAVADADHGRYGFVSHQGYGSTKHMAAITDLGPVPRLHRFTFAPIKIA